MKPLDYAKALGFALLILIANIAISFGVVWVYSVAIEPGQDEAFYQAAALKIAPVSGIIGGFVLVAAASLVLAQRRPQRPAYAFGALIAAGYMIIDIPLVLAMAPTAFAEHSLLFAASYASKFAAAVVGAALVRKPSPRLT